MEKTKQGEYARPDADAWDKLEYELDLCVNVLKNGPTRIGRVRKSRLQEFPDASTFTWSYKDFADKYGMDIIQKKSEKIELATEEQLKEMERLFSTVKLPDGQEEKWLKSAQVDDWTEMTSAKIGSLIEHIKKTYLNNEGNK